MTRILREKGRTDNEEVTLRRKSGDVLIVLSSTQVININGAPCPVSVASDITERKKAETELREYQEKLKAMASDIVQTEERDRQHLAVGLHDDICQKLVLTKLTIESSLR